MKKIIFAAPLLALFFAACDPITEGGGSGFNEDVTADNVDIKATPVQINGKNTNYIVVENHSKINGQWRASQLIEDSTVTARSYDTIYVTKTGTTALNFVGINSKTRFSKSVDVSVDQIYYLTSALQTRLCVSGTAGNYTSKADGTTPVEFNNSFDQSKISVKQVEANGKKGNYLTIQNLNGNLCNWSLGTATSNKNNVEKLFVTTKGTFDLNLKYTLADGTSKTIKVGTYSVDTLSYIPEELGLLGGETTSGKAWKWYAKSSNGVWGNGSYLNDQAPGWWKVQYADIDGQASGKGTIEKDGSGVTAVFNRLAGTYTKNNGDTGTYIYDVTDHAPGAADGWDKGSITFKNVNIPMGYLVNNGNAIPDKYYVVKLTNHFLTLCAPEPGSGSGGTAWYWVFEWDESE